MLSVRATSSSSVLPFRSVWRFCSDCFVSRAPSFNTVHQVVVGMVTRAAVEAATICANLLVVYCRNDSSLPLFTLKTPFRRRSLDSSSWIQPALASKTFKIDSTPTWAVARSSAAQKLSHSHLHRSSSSCRREQKSTHSDNAQTSRIKCSRSTNRSSLRRSARTVEPSRSTRTGTMTSTQPAAAAAVAAANPYSVTCHWSCCVTKATESSSLSGVCTALTGDTQLDVNVHSRNQERDACGIEVP